MDFSYMVIRFDNWRYNLSNALRFLSKRIMTFYNHVKNAFSLKCPSCMQDRIFAGILKMHTKCRNCLYIYELEQGYFIGAIYINYATTVFTCFILYNILSSSFSIKLEYLIIILSLFCIIFPIFFFRFSRSLWINIDFFINKTVTNSSEKKEL